MDRIPVQEVHGHAPVSNSTMGGVCSCFGSEDDRERDRHQRQNNSERAAQREQVARATEERLNQKRKGTLGKKLAERQANPHGPPPSETPLQWRAEA
ncbi:hypothetical protein PSACC_00261 [Paramicrosporidium saccamoebae]|uniref:Uncharacterized protein n=1 Tax=Paramicrosporidium saccamoebae TaxID=1246581 RepID=A0A2H9TQ91_9FUNG|nr:hypothetical protein PSACC_00261 [Paramicrosporidium saccamoebae]